MERRSSSGPFSEDKTLRDCQDPGRLLRAVTDTPLWKNRPHERTHRLLQGLPYVATWANVGACAPNPGVSRPNSALGAPVPPLRPCAPAGWAGWARRSWRRARRPSAVPRSLGPSPHGQYSGE